MKIQREEERRKHEATVLKWEVCYDLRDREGSSGLNDFTEMIFAADDAEYPPVFTYSLCDNKTSEDAYKVIDQG